MEQRRLCSAIRCLCAVSGVGDLFLRHCCFKRSQIHILCVLHKASSKTCWLTILVETNIGFDVDQHQHSAELADECGSWSEVNVRRLSFPSLHSSTRRLPCRPRQSRSPPSSSASWRLGCCSASHCLWSSERWSGPQRPAVSTKRFHRDILKLANVKPDSHCIRHVDNLSCTAGQTWAEHKLALKFDWGEGEECLGSPPRSSEH